MARMMNSPMRNEDHNSDTYSSHPSPYNSSPYNSNSSPYNSNSSPYNASPYNPSRYSRTYSSLSNFSHPEESHDMTPQRKFTPPPRPPSSPMLNRLSIKKKTDVPFSNNTSEEEVELDLMREKYTKLLLGEDMSGGGKGVCTAVAITNSITNLFATIFGTCHKLEPLQPEKKAMWRREMDCFLSICDFIFDPSPTELTMPGGSANEVIAARSRTDIIMNLPTLEKFENMLLEILDSFHCSEFSYEKKQSMDEDSFQRSEDKWWLPVPCLPQEGLPERTRKDLQQKRASANQIHKAAMAINNAILGEMEVPDSYITTLPKSGRASVGDVIYKHMQTPDQFSADHVLATLNISSEHEALEIADKVEAAMYIWKRKVNLSHSKSAWDMNLVSLMEDGDKNVVLASRAQSLLLSLKHRYPSLSQTTLDTSKIQLNKDVGQAILESYSRVLESLAYNIVSWIEDVQHADDAARKRITGYQFAPQK